MFRQAGSVVFYLSIVLIQCIYLSAIITLWLQQIAKGLAMYIRVEKAMQKHRQNNLEDHDLALTSSLLQHPGYSTENPDPG